MRKPTLEQLRDMVVETMNRQIKHNPRFARIAADPELALMIKDVAAHVAMSVDCMIDDLNEEGADA